MKKIAISVCLVFALLGTTGVCAQQTETGSMTNEARVPLTEQALAHNLAGDVALAGRLRTPVPAGTPDAPARDVLLVIENRSTVFYTFVSGWVTFYDAGGVRCGTGLWKAEALAPGESAEVDAPGLRLICTPASWRITASTLLTRTGDTAKPTAPQQNAPSGNPPAPAPTPANPKPATPPLAININGTSLPLQLGNPVEITIGKENIRIVVSAMP